MQYSEDQIYFSNYFKTGHKNLNFWSRVTGKPGVGTVFHLFFPYPWICLKKSSNTLPYVHIDWEYVSPIWQASPKHYVHGGCAAVACILFDFVTNNLKIMVDFMQIILKNIPDFMSIWIDSISNR